MKSSALRSALALVVVFSILNFTPQVLAQTNKSSPEKKTTTAKSHSSEHKAKPIPFSGNIKSLDTSAKTINIDKRTLLITAQTKIIQDEKPTTLDKAAVGDYVTGSYHKTEDGKLIANSVYIGGKSKPRPAEVKK